MKSNILKKGALVNEWPGKDNVYKCEMLAADNKHYEALIPKAECELVMYLKLLKGKISEKEMVKLEALIDEFGDERYDTAVTDESIRNAGPEL